MKLSNWFRNPPEPTPVKSSKVRFVEAIQELNRAWADMPKGIAPWTDWRNRRIVVSAWTNERVLYTPEEYLTETPVEMENEDGY